MKQHLLALKQAIDHIDSNPDTSMKFYTTCLPSTNNDKNITGCFHVPEVLQINQIFEFSLNTDVAISQAQVLENKQDWSTIR